MAGNVAELSNVGGIENAGLSLGAEDSGRGASRRFEHLPEGGILLYVSEISSDLRAP